MRSRSTGALVCLALFAIPFVRPALAADPPRRKPLSNDERVAALNLIKAVDLAQETDVVADPPSWDHHVIKSSNLTAYVPFRLSIGALADQFKSAVMYVRAVTRHDGVRARDERSAARDWLQHDGGPLARMPETVFLGTGEMPVGGPGVGSSRRSTVAEAEASTRLALQQREAERQSAAAAAARRKAETKERDPFLFPFEDYYVLDLKAGRSADARTIERAVALPPGEFDVYVALIDRARLKTSGVTVVKQTWTIPDFWNDQLGLSSLILAADVRTLAATLSPQQQPEHPYAFGHAEVVPTHTATFTPRDVLSVVYQICNYGAPDADLQAEYNFYRTDGGSRTLFNHTEPQRFGDNDLPPPKPWETQAFAAQTVPLESFPPGSYELEVIVRDRLTRGSASNTVAFTVAAR